MTRQLAFGLDRGVEILEATDEEREGLEDSGDVTLGPGRYKRKLN